MGRRNISELIDNAQKTENAFERSLLLREILKHGGSKDITCLIKLCISKIGFLTFEELLDVVFYKKIAISHARLLIKILCNKNDQYLLRLLIARILSFETTVLWEVLIDDVFESGNMLAIKILIEEVLKTKNPRYIEYLKEKCQDYKISLKDAKSNVKEIETNNPDTI